MEVVALVIGGVAWLGYAYVTIRQVATESLGEIRFCLRCAKDRKEESCTKRPDIAPELQKALDNDIEFWQKKLDNHWGKRLAKGRISSFDRIPTPQMDVDGSYIAEVLKKVKKCPHNW